jgi:hypothetical protein
MKKLFLFAFLCLATFFVALQSCSSSSAVDMGSIKVDDTLVLKPALYACDNPWNFKKQEKEDAEKTDPGFAEISWNIYFKCQDGATESNQMQAMFGRFDTYKVIDDKMVVSEKTRKYFDREKLKNKYESLKIANSEDFFITVKRTGNKESPTYELLKVRQIIRKVENGRVLRTAVDPVKVIWDIEQGGGTYDFYDIE